MKNLCEHFRESSKYVREWLSLQPAVKEESLTDWLLYDISKHVPNIYYTAFTRHQEAKETGADWEWWILFHQGAMRFRVQAKKISSSSDNYPSIAHSNRHGLQIDLLLSASTNASTNAIPLYALYATGGSGMCLGQTLIQHDDGVFLAGGRTVYRDVFERPKRSVSAADLLVLSNPFSCFACCPLVLGEGGSFRRFLQQYYSAEMERKADSEEELPGFHAQVPGYVTSFIQFEHGKQSVAQGSLPSGWEREYGTQLQEFRALLVYDFRQEVSETGDLPGDEFSML